ncbi:DUF4403 family protein [Gemmatimonas phototrophica]|uniref:DUF4403 family protein n=1 Tax=Gemmatimonas phototrophica TaxID=1379270 RepID=A0A143BJM1_9BACT|nr:DUF4403 family protein [Gemmatimonas phototrophica]AMW04731.1 hypothetical protein GEMMAAP_07520 [Gemmatimonas phototrophica]
MNAGLAIVPVQVTYVLRALRPTLDSIFPVRDSLSAARCANAAGLVCHQYVYRRDPLQLRGEGNRLFITTELAFRARLGVVGGARVASCGYDPEAMRRASLAMSTALYWRRDWRIGAQDSRLAATLRDPCLVTAFGVNATRTLQNVVDRQLETFAADADTAIPVAADFRPLADSLWRSFLEPTALDSLNSLWLLLEPEAVRVTPFVGNGINITTTMVLYARPRVVAGSKPVVRPRPLPALALGQAPRDFTVPVTVELPFAEMARRATQLLAEETAQQSVKIDSVFVRGAGDTVLVDLAVSGALRGRLGLTSRLRWDATARELRLDDLDWTLQSRGALSRVKTTLATPLVALAVRRATSGGRVPLGAQLDSVRAELLFKLNGTLAPGVVMGSSVRDVQILQVSTTASAIVVRALLTGQSGVWIQ